MARDWARGTGEAALRCRWNVQRGRGGDQLDCEGGGGGGTEGGLWGKAELCVIYHVMLLGGSMILAPHIVCDLCGWP
jgi:hypothetical protein